MKKSFAVCFAAAVLFVQNISGQQLGELYTEKNGGFTMSMPRGWQTYDFNQKYLMIVGPEENGSVPNIGFGDEEFEGTVSDYLDAAMSVFPLIFSEFNLVSRANFKTDAGVTGEYILHQSTMGAIQVRQKVYVFPNRSGTAVMIITGTAPVSGGERFDALFDASVRTFEWSR